MACFWNALNSKLRRQDLKTLLNGQPYRPQRLAEACRRLERVHPLTPEAVTWQGQSLTAKEVHEHTQWLREYDVGTVNQGKLVSIQDPHLLWLCSYLKINVHHRFLSVSIKYEVPSPRYTISLRSDRGHIQ